jgi:large subunit ribosomal protein L6
MKKAIKKIIEIPEGIDINVKGNTFKVKGSLGESENSVKFKKNIKIEIKDKTLEISCEKASKKEKKIIGTIKSKIDNMIYGVTNGYTYKLEICSIHFPITAKVEGDKFTVKNFIGENKDRVVKITPGIEVKIEGNKVIVTSIDKEKAGQMAADIEILTRIRGYDRRIFQDGIWIIEKEKGRPGRGIRK